MTARRTAYEQALAGKIKGHYPLMPHMTSEANPLAGLKIWLVLMVLGMLVTVITSAPFDWEAFDADAKELARLEAAK